MVEPRSRIAWVLVGLAVLAIGGCGGKVETSEDGTDSPSSGGAKSDAGTHGSNGGEPLGECKLGPSASKYPGVPCAWLGDGRCYAEKKDACNCVCPRDHDSVCWSDFPTGTTPTLVYCD
jgi:hypothetical protein